MCRGNPPKGFLSSKVTCGNDDVTVIVIQCHCRRQCLKKHPHSAATPTAHPRRVQKGTRNEICLTASEILLRKVKSVCDG